MLRATKGPRSVDQASNGPEEALIVTHVKSPPQLNLTENGLVTSDLNTGAIPNATGTDDRSSSLRAYAWAGVVMSGLCTAFAIRVFFIMLAPTHSFGTAFNLWRHDKGVFASVSAALVLILGSLLTFARVRRAESWAQLTRVDRALSVMGIIPASLLYYPIMIAATFLGLVLFFCILLLADFVGRIERLTQRKNRVRAR